MSRVAKQQVVAGYSFIAPNFLAFLVFVSVPFVAGLVLTFTAWDLLSPPQWVGVQNYVALLTSDILVWLTCGTRSITLVTVPAIRLHGLAFSSTRRCLARVSIVRSILSRSWRRVSPSPWSGNGFTTASSGC